MSHCKIPVRQGCKAVRLKYDTIIYLYTHSQNLFSGAGLGVMMEKVVNAIKKMI